MTEQEQIEYCAKVHLPRRRMDPSELHVHYNTLMIGFQVLARCLQQWKIHASSVIDLRKHIMGELYRLPEHTQWYVYRVVNKLLGCENCVEHDVEVVELGDFEVSALLWLFKIGVQEVALAIVQPRSALDLSLAVEQGWLLQNAIDENKTEIQIFVTDLHIWGHGVAMRSMKNTAQGT